MARKRNTIKENWTKVDETCPNCHQVTKQVRGLTKQNLRKLIVPKWDMTEVIITLLLIALIVLSLVYKAETQQCRDFLADGAVAEQGCNMEVAIGGQDYSPTNLPNLTNITLNR